MSGYLSSRVVNIKYLDHVQIIKASDYYVVSHINERTIQPNKIVLVYISAAWMASPEPVKHAYDLLIRRKLAHKVIILYNAPNEKELFETRIADIFSSADRSGVELLFCNNNAFVDENKFYIANADEGRRIYDLVINSRFCAYKNVQVANQCHNTIHIGYLDQSPTRSVIPTFGKLANYIARPTSPTEIISQYNPLRQHQINQILNQSSVGGIFSEIEGACRASAEYLLCGLPVISSACQGGREIWYNSNNSIICQECTPETVYDACQKAKENLANGSFQRAEIRKQHIAQSNEHRDRLWNHCQQKLVEFGQNDLHPSLKNRLKKDLLAKH